MSTREIFSAIFLCLGTYVLLMDSLGFYRFKNVLTRMHAATKGSTVGMGFILVGTMIYFWELNTVFKLVMLLILFFLTAPVGAQAIARAAYTSDEVYNELKDSLWIDDLSRHYPDRMTADETERSAD